MTMSMSTIVFMTSPPLCRYGLNYPFGRFDRGDGGKVPEKHEKYKSHLMIRKIVGRKCPNP
jgi:hypothetical protein